MDSTSCPPHPPTTDSEPIHLQRLKSLQTSLGSNRRTRRIRTRHYPPIRNRKSIPRTLWTHVRGSRTGGAGLDGDGAPFFDLFLVAEIRLALVCEAGYAFAGDYGAFGGGVDDGGEDCAAVAYCGYDGAGGVHF